MKNCDVSGVLQHSRQTRADQALMLARGLLCCAVSVAAAAAEYTPEGVCHHKQPGLVDPSLFKPVRHQQRAQKVLAAAKALMSEPSCGVAPDPGVIVPSAFGADPTGKADASPAMDKAVAAMLAHKVGVDGSPCFRSLFHFSVCVFVSFLLCSLILWTDMGIYDLGGVTLDLDGGSYSLSRPLLIPQHYGNFKVMRGTLFAGRSFPVSTPDDPEMPESGLHFLLQVRLLLLPVASLSLNYSSSFPLSLSLALSLSHLCAPGGGARQMQLNHRWREQQELRKLRTQAICSR